MANPLTHKARKRFGQHFLHDPQIIERIIQVIHPLPGQPLVEIGPGQGAITLPLLSACKQLDVIELDRDLVQPLKNLTAGSGDLAVHQHDALRFDFLLLAAGRKLRIVGNLPYNISTPLLFHLIDQSASIQDMHFMLQKEVIDRMAASPGTRDYGRLSVMIQLHCKVEPLFQVEPGAFKPAPKVHSGFVRLTPWDKAPVSIDNLPAFTGLVRQAFSQRRKTLRNTLRGVLSAEQISSCDIDPGARAETLTLEQFSALGNYLANNMQGGHDG